MLKIYAYDVHPLSSSGRTHAHKEKSKNFDILAIAILYSFRCLWYLYKNIIAQINYFVKNVYIVIAYYLRY